MRPRSERSVDSLECGLPIPHVLQAAQVKARRDRIKEQESEIAQLKKQLGSDKVTFGGRTGGRDLYSAVPAEYLCPITQVQHSSSPRSSASHSFCGCKKDITGSTCYPGRLQPLLLIFKALPSTVKTIVRASNNTIAKLWDCPEP